MLPVNNISKSSRTAWYLCSLYLFFNSLLLPGGLFFTSLLAPVLFVFSGKGKVGVMYSCVLLFMALFLTVQWPGINNPGYYARSLVLTLLHLPFLSIVAQYFKNASEQQNDTLVKKASYLNLILVVMALVALFITALRPLFWYQISITQGSGIIPRLKLFQSEASVYSFIMAPVFLYVTWQFVALRNVKTPAFLAFVVLPLLLSLSFGVCGSILLSVAVTFICYPKTLGTVGIVRRNIIYFLGVLILFMLWWRVQPDNVLFHRISNIISGKDTSANGRTYESFGLALKTLQQNDCLWWGIGPGQFKILGKELLLTYYQYSGNVTDIRIPNACADMLVTYGIAGITIKIVLEIFFFIKTRVFDNYYRFSLFAFLFLYQFTGSYYNNLIELVGWVLVFTGLFSAFSKKNT